MIAYSLCAEEAKLLDDIDEVGHGELYDVALIEPQPRNQRIEIHESCVELIKTLREDRIFMKLVIHGGLPRYAEIQGKTESGRRYLQKLKFT